MTQCFLYTPDKCNDMQAVQELFNYMQNKYADVFQGNGCFKGTVPIDRQNARPYQELL